MGKKLYRPNYYVVHYSYYCCDTGRGSKTYEFNTLGEALKFYRSWRKQIDATGMGWSDGFEEMSEPIHVMDDIKMRIERLRLNGYEVDEDEYISIHYADSEAS